MDNWNNPIDYWDQNKKAILRNTRRLDKLGDTDRKAAYEQIRDTIRRYAHQLEDEQLMNLVVTMVEDLYKFANEEAVIVGPLFEYLDAFGRTLTKIVRERGYVIRYVVGNQFFDVDLLMLGPFKNFHKTFNVVGFVYICPQLLGFNLMQHDGIKTSEYLKVIPRYIDEARDVSNNLVTKCKEENRHYTFLEVDYQVGVLDIALEGREAPGVLSIFRNEAPIAGSKVAITFPKQKLGE